MKNIEIIEKIEKFHTASHKEFVMLLSTVSDYEIEILRAKAQSAAIKCYGKKIFIRGLIEFSSFCKNDCYYCGLRRSNKNAVRYRLTKTQILQCCRKGYELGFRTFVLQSGEDSFFDDDKMCDIIRSIKEKYPDCAVTLSIGERNSQSFKRLYLAGADRYLLRHETANRTHYSLLHPSEMSFDNRMNCLRELKKTGFQTGAGFMVGSPCQTFETIADDLIFLSTFKPHMCGIGPFIHHSDTPFSNKPDGSVKLCLVLLSVIRLLLPNVLLPATTALGTADTNGREKGILHGANVVMPNLSPIEHRKDYSLYNNKICTGNEAAESIKAIAAQINSIGYEIVTDIGNFKY